MACLDDSGPSANRATAASVLDVALQYEQRSAPADMRADVAGVWHSRVAAGGHRQRLLPDGCIEISFGRDRLPIVYGPRTSWYELHIPAGEHLGVRLLPGAASGLLGIDADELADRCAEVDELGVVEALALLHSQTGIGVAVTARRIGISERHLRRRFTRAVGLSPATYGRIARVNATLRAARAQPSRPWARLAAELGYSDQAHLSREVKALTGSPPNTFRRPRVHIPT